MNIRKRIAQYLSSTRSKLINGKREEVSYSRLSMMARCPQQHHLRYKKHYRSKTESSNLFFGKGVHSVLAYFYDNNMRPEKKDLLEYWEQAYKGALDTTQAVVTWKEGESFESSLEYGARMIAKYYDTYADFDRENYEVLEVEKPFWIPIITENSKIDKKYMLTGIIDLILKDKEDNIIIVDHKTLSRKMVESAPLTAYQITEYYLGALYLGYVATKAMYNNLYKTKDPNFGRLETTRTEDQLEDFMASARDITKAIQIDLKHKNYGQACYSCDMRDLCINKNKDSVYECTPSTLSDRFNND